MNVTPLPIVWNKHLSVGVSKLDQEHKKIISIINQLVSHKENNISTTPFEVIEQLISYADIHFNSEEKLLAHYDYPELRDQKEDHLDYSLKMTEFYQAALNNKQELPDKILSFVTDWWLDHILVDDMKYKDFLTSKGLN